MYVFGCTPEKEVVRVQMDIDEVIEKQIDPWRLDLFDPRPVHINMDGRKLAFTSVGDLSLAYESKGDHGADTAVIVAHDGEHASCIRGDICPSTVREGDGQVLVLRNYEVLPASSFDEHFRRYLLLTYHSLPYMTFFAERRQRCGWGVRPYGNVWMRQGQIELRSSSYHADLRTTAAWLTCRFAGDMFDMQRVGIRCPEPILSVVSALAEWQPQISEGVDALAIARGIPVSSVEITVTEVVDGVMSRLREAGLREFGPGKFTGGGVEFSISQRRAAPALPPSFSSQIAMDGPDTMVASRIALFDLARGQQRLLVPAPAVRAKRHLRQPDCQSQIDSPGTADLTFLPDVFAGSHPLPGCHSEPVLRLYAEVFRYAACLDWEAVQQAGLTGAQLMKFVEGKDRAYHPGTARMIMRRAIEETDGPATGQISPELMENLLARAAAEVSLAHGEGACLTTRYFKDFLLKWLDEELAVRRHRNLWADWLKGWLEKECRRPLLAYAFRCAGIPNIEEMIGEYGRKYISYAACLSGASPAASRQPSEMEAFLHEVEMEARVTSTDVQTFRTQMMTAALTMKHVNEIPQALYEAVESLLLRTSRFWIAPSTKNTLEQQRLERVKGALVGRHGFCKTCCEALLDEVASSPDFFTPG